MYLCGHLFHPDNISVVRLITVAIHTYDRAIELKQTLEAENIPVVLQNVNLETPDVSPGIRVRIHENDLPLALRIIENNEIFKPFRKAVPGNSILVPVDFSEYSLRSVDVAFRLAEEHNAGIVILHSYINPSATESIQLSDALNFDLSVDSEIRRQNQLAAEMRMSKFEQQVRDRIKRNELPPVKFSTEVIEGVPEDVIDEYVKQNPPFLVVMGTRGAKRKLEEMIGSVTAEVLDKCRTSVLTLPETFGNTDDKSFPGRILFFCGLDQADILALDTMSRVFPDSKAQVTLFNVPPRRRYSLIERPVHENMMSLLRYCEKYYPHLKFRINEVPWDPKAADASINAALNAEADLIVIPNKKKRNMFARLINPGLAHRLLLDADIPMLVIRV